MLKREGINSVKNILFGEIPSSGTFLRVERKLTLTTKKLILVLFALVVPLTFLGNVLIILAARKITCNGERTITIDLGNRLESLPRRRDSASDVREVSTTSSIKGMEFIRFKVQYIMILSLCVRFQVDSVS